MYVYICVYVPEKMQCIQMPIKPVFKSPSYT